MNSVKVNFCGENLTGILPQSWESLVNILFAQMESKS